MATFFFFNPREVFANVSGNSVLNYSESGVNFTFSIQNGDGSNIGLIGDSDLRGVTDSGSNLASQDIFILDVTGVSQTRFDGTIVLSVTNLRGTWTVNGQALVSGLNTLTGPQANLTFTSSSSSNGLFEVNRLIADITCFTAGTCIATPDGPRAVEKLEPGDPILTAAGTISTVRWLARQPIDTTLNHPAKINPICITAGALGYNLPERDLRVSPDHGIAIDGYLINAGALVNGTTIYQERNVSEDFTYYHIETDAHELILAEGVAAETFADFSARVDFENADEASGRVIPEMPLPRISSARMVPAHVKSYLGEVRVA
jgi:hypothetical protein